MTNRELINQIARRTSMTKTQTEEMMNATIAVLQKNLLTGNAVQLQNFGTLEMKRREARTVVLPKTGERTTVPEKMQLVFKPYPTIKEQLKNINDGE